MARLISKDKAADILGVTISTINNWCRDGVFKTHTLKTGGRTATMLDSYTILSLVDTTEEAGNARRKLQEMREKCEENYRWMKKTCDYESRLRAIYEKADYGFTERFRGVCMCVLDAGKELLTTKEYLVIKGMIDGTSLDEQAEDWGVSRGRIFQIITKDLWKLEKLNTLPVMMAEKEQLRGELDTLRRAYDEACTKLARYEEAAKCNTAEPNNEMVLLFAKKVRDLPFTIRALNCLKSADIETVGDLVRTNPKELLRHRNCGRKTIWELSEYIEREGLSWDMDTEAILRATLTRSQKSE